MFQKQDITQIFSQKILDQIFPPEKTNAFFEAMLGDASEGAYDIRLVFQGVKENIIQFAFELTQRPGKCLVCSVTYGLPQVFKKHRIINTENIVNQIMTIIGNANVISWELRPTLQIEQDVHLVPLHITLDQML
jgi:hypothetical protein